jgi:hypothetical protein
MQRLFATFRNFALALGLAGTTLLAQAQTHNRPKSPRVPICCST